MKFVATLPAIVRARVGRDGCFTASGRGHAKRRVWRALENTVDAEIRASRPTSAPTSGYWLVARAILVFVGSVDGAAAALALTSTGALPTRGIPCASAPKRRRRWLRPKLMGREYVSREAWEIASRS